MKSKYSPEVCVGWRVAITKYYRSGGWDNSYFFSHRYGSQSSAKGSARLLLLRPHSLPCPHHPVSQVFLCMHTSVASGCPSVFVWECWSDGMRANHNRAALVFPFRIPVKASMNLWFWSINFGRHILFHSTEWGQKASDPLFWDYMFSCNANPSQDLRQCQYNAFKIK